MKLYDAIQKAYETKWSFINTFNVQIDLPPTLIADSGWTEEDSDSINLHIINCDTPQFTNSGIQAFVGNRWVMHNGRDELYRFSITFRDRDRMDLYRKFIKMYKSTKESYFDVIKMTVILSKEGDWYNEKASTLFKFENTIIDSISQLQFNNTTENQIAEFTVQFKCSTPLILGSTSKSGISNFTGI